MSAFGSFSVRGLLAVALVLASASGAWAQPAEGESPDDVQARTHFQAGRNYYDAGQFEDAAREFERAYALSPRPLLLLNLYFARRDQPDYAAAADALRRYLDADTELSADERATYETRLQALEAAAAGEGPPPEPEPDPADGGGGIGPLPGIITAGVGGVALVISLIELVLMEGARSDYDALCGPDPNRCPASEAMELDSLADSFETHRDLAWGFFIGGMVAVAAGGALLILGLSGGSSETAPSAACDGDGCWAGVTGSF